MSKKRNKSTRTSPATSDNSQNLEKWLPLILAGLSFLLFSMGFRNEMLSMDDHAATVNNPAVTDLDLFQGYNLGMFAPITWMGYAMAYMLGEDGSFWYHLFSALVHAVNVWLVFHLFRKLGSSVIISGFVAFFFAVHPLQVESVAWIAGFSTPLFSAFCLLSMTFYLDYVSEGKYGRNYIMALLFFLLACLSKSAAVTLPLTLLVIDLWVKRDRTKQMLVDKVPFLALSLAFGLLTLVTRQHAGQLDQPADFSMLDRVLMACHTVLFYWKKLIMPTGLSIWYPFEKVDGSWDWSYYAAPFVLSGILILAWRFRSAWPLLWIGILFYLSNIVLALPWSTFGTFELRSDRYNYLACLGVFAFLTALPGYIKQYKESWVTGFWAALVGLGALWLFSAGSRLQDWKNTITLIDSALETTGDNFGKAYLWRGTILADDGKGDPALEDFNKALSINPLLYDAYKYRGNIMGVRKQYEQSIVDLSKYIEHFPDAAPEIYNRGLSYVNLGNDSAALADFNRCLEIDPDFYRAYRARGNTLLNMGETEKGNADLQEYDRRNPQRN
ncbi:MAG: tetratricopeptide repeat protein [Lewinellaceae bacterium]|nr:tetratricopeptide repeat protein [Saprospiraceae bacterium]MCB9343764.1 tetratricopeptide repeat protein [Lewinellaceae bacterium]